MKPFVILDRDGTIIVEEYYLSDPAKVALCKNAGEGLRRLTELGCGLAVIERSVSVLSLSRGEGAGPSRSYALGSNSRKVLGPYHFRTFCTYRRSKRSAFCARFRSQL